MLFDKGSAQIAILQILKMYRASLFAFSPFLLGFLPPDPSLAMSYGNSGTK